MASDVASLDYETSSSELSDEGLEHDSNPEQNPDLYGEEQIGSPARPPNPPSPFLWRGLTVAEREISNSLERARSSDLSIHLYNAWKLKQAVQAKVPDQNGFVETKEPPRTWAAWPMPPDLVPREHETKRWEDEDWRVGPYVNRERRPGDELRELLTARVLKTAKERLMRRGSVETSEDGQEDDYTKPVIIADDDKATQVLRPSVQHVLGKLDSMLMGLHHGRSYYSTVRILKPRRKDSLSRAAPSQSTVTAETNNTAAVKNGNNMTNSDVELSMGEDSKISKEQKRSKSPVKTYNLLGGISRSGRMGLRGWSDMINMATMTGIDSAVIDRTSSRCKTLIGEDMRSKPLNVDLREGKQSL